MHSHLWYALVSHIRFHRSYFINLYSWNKTIALLISLLYLTWCFRSFNTEQQNSHYHEGEWKFFLNFVSFVFIHLIIVEKYRFTYTRLFDNENKTSWANFYSYNAHQHLNTLYTYSTRHIVGELNPCQTWIGLHL